MSRAALKIRVKLLAKEFAPEGFVPDRTWSIIRHVPHLSQILELQPGDSSLQDQFTCNVAWRFTLDGEPPSGFSYCAGIGQFLGVIGDVWYAHEPREALEANFAELVGFLRGEVLPFLDSALDLATLLRRYEEAIATDKDLGYHEVNPRHFFGSSPGWACYNLGWAYRTLGNRAKARRHFKTVTNEHSAEPYAWIQARKARSLQALREL